MDVMEVKATNRAEAIMACSFRGAQHPGFLRKSGFRVNGNSLSNQRGRNIAWIAYASQSSFVCPHYAARFTVPHRRLLLDAVVHQPAAGAAARARRDRFRGSALRGVGDGVMDRAGDAGRMA